MIVLGRIVAPFGIQGWVKIHPFGDDPASWRKLSHWWLSRDDDAPDAQWRDLLAAGDDPEEDWQALALRGGFPTPALELEAPADRAIWFDGYVRTYLERDLQDLASISALPSSSFTGARLMVLAARSIPSRLPWKKR